MSRLAALVRQSIADPRPDGVLLGAFLADRDEAAFGELVRRHAPLVWGVCRRGLPDPADAEDAFQATFLVLVRRANRLTGSATVGPWLYKVAAWTAGNLRRKNARRLARHRELPDAVPDPRPTPEPSFDLDADLLALPERYRAALVLCCLEGLTHREAADRLDCAEGTVSSLVSRGLAKLRVRLAGRETAALAAAAAVLVPDPLSAAVVRSAAALRIASLSAAASPAVAELTAGVLRMFWVKKATAAAVAATVLLAVGVAVGLGVRQTPAAAAQEKPVPAKKQTGDSAPPPAAGEQKRRMVIELHGRDAAAPYTVTEYGPGGAVAWTVKFGPGTDWADMTPLKQYLARVPRKKGDAPEVAVSLPPGVLDEQAMWALRACAEVGIERVRFTGYLFPGGFRRLPDPKAPKGLDGFDHYQDKEVEAKELADKIAKALRRL